MLRLLLLYLSGSRLARKFVLSFPLARKVARRYVAGECLEDALEVTRKLNLENLLVTLDLLGENAVIKADADKATEEYLTMIEKVGQSGLACSFSLKLTQLGLDQGVEVALNNLKRILERTQALNLFVRIDMEGSKYTEQTIEVFRRARAEFEQVGIVIQAYLHRSKQDIAAINKFAGRIRLCKGAYSELPAIALQNRHEVTANMKALMHELMREGHYPAIASHDEEIIQDTLQTVQELGIPAEQFEFQMLYGIRSQRQLELCRQGFRVRVYVPFGSDWYPYFMRRLAERPANLIFFLTALFRG